MNVRSEPSLHSDEQTGRGICDRLIDAGLLEPGNAERALHLQRQQTLRVADARESNQARESSAERIGSILVKLDLVSERDLAENLAEQLDVGLVTREDFPEEMPVIEALSAQFLEENHILVLHQDATELRVVMAEPQDAYLRKALQLSSGCTVTCCLGLPSEIQVAIQELQKGAESPGRASSMLDDSVQFLDDVEQLKELAGEAPIIKLVNQIIREAAEAGASDIHIEPFEGQLSVRYRIDGMLREVASPPNRYTPAIISRVKIMANMNIAERRLSQDGRFRQRVRGEEFDLRVSTVPTMHGESVVLRLLRRDEIEFDFRTLGFSPEQETTMHELLGMPHGIVLVTGPTGSGKTTTIYAALRHLHSPERMIITVEDPIEYNIRGINQMQAKPQIGFTFASALRSIVRQDPDVIMVGEIRDAETAQIAVQSALTGHLVLSTLHTNDAAGSILRLLDMGVQDYLLTSAVNAVQAQRLVRTLCNECRQLYEPIDDQVKRKRLDALAPNGTATIYEAIGCESCGGTGYSGRTTIVEILRITDAIGELVLRHSDLSEIARVAEDQGMVPGRESREPK